jgi:hypothetical protein
LIPQKHLIRKLFKIVLNIEDDNDFTTAVPADSQEIADFIDGITDGPDIQHLQFDLLGKAMSEWNLRACDLLREQLYELDISKNWGLPERSKEYIDEAIMFRFKRLHTRWRSCQPRTKASGKLETPDEVEIRVIQGGVSRKKLARQATRRSTVSTKHCIFVSGLI